MSAPQAAVDAVRQHLAATPTRAKSLGGQAFVVTVSDSGRVLAKHGAGRHAARAEGAGLRWLGEHDDVPVPTVHGYDDDWLVTEFIPAGAPNTAAAEKLGRGLARMHGRGAPAFGSPPPDGPADAWIGLAPMRNEPVTDWPSFYARHRLEPYVRDCVDQGLFTSDQATVFERVYARLPDLAGTPEPPARLHGDAWSGNVHWAADGNAWLIDPAAHGGHRETDLAMLHLFGTPLLDHILGGYVEAAQEQGAPLDSGWRERTALHQLFPLLVHAALFGGGYVQQTLATARRVIQM